MAVLAWIVGAVVALALVGWLGMQVKPTPFAAYPEASREVSAKMVPIPSGLPAPVGRYYRRLYGDAVPVIDSVVITGRGRLSPAGGVWLPMRYRFTHDAGRGYRHYIEATWFGMPVMRVNERYVDGTSLMELPWATDQGPKIEQAANLGMWAELAGSAPSVLLTDARVKWEPYDANTALLVVPLGEDGQTDRFVVHFDPATGKQTFMEAMRYRDSKSAEKILWIAKNEPGATIGALKLPAVGSATWMDMGRPWAYFGAEELRYNVDVSAYLRARGL